MRVISTPGRIPLSVGARQINLTSPGLLKILRRTNSAIRDDGRWYVDPVIIERIAEARRVLGIDRNKSPNALRGAK
jgi:hypothetical protein